jgi:Tfp pilus assembly protein PilF
LLASLGGCQSPSGLSSFRLPWSKTASVGQRPPPPLPPTTKPLTSDQKAEIQMAFARGLERQGRTDEAKKIYLELVKTSPKRADVHHCLALLHDRKGECRAAEAYYQKALRLAPENAEAYCDLGYSYYLQQRWQDAEEQLRRAVALEPDLRRAHNNLGLLLTRTGREAEAFDAFAKAGCSEAEAHANVALALSLAERWDEARAHYRRALALDPNLKPAQQGAASLETVAGKLPGTNPPPAVPPFAAGIAPVSHQQ